MDTNCKLCEYWKGLDFHSRHTTPIPVDDAHRAFVTGWWTREAFGTDNICAQHAEMIDFANHVAQSNASKKAASLAKQELETKMVQEYQERIKQLETGTQPPSGPPAGFFPPAQIAPTINAPPKTFITCMFCGAPVEAGTNTHQCNQ